MSRRTLASRIAYYGGDQLSRINKQKLRSLQAALLNDHNSRTIMTPSGKIYQALINRNNLKADYDKEYVSVEFDSGLEAGDVFEILDDHSHWMVYLPMITETAYLRAEIIKCRYQLEVDGQVYWVYFQGPTETDIRWQNRTQVNVNELNLSGTIYIKNDEKTKAHFKRFTKFKIAGHTWQVQVSDSITVPGILELEVQEYYDEPVAELPQVIQEDILTTNTIIGLSSIKADSTAGYAIVPEKYSKKAKWEIANNPRVRVDEVYEDGRMCKVRLLRGAAGSFDLKYADEVLHIEIEEPENFIHGPQTVYPYETHSYWIEGTTGVFEVDNDNARIIQCTEDSCKIEIISGKQGKFRVGCRALDGTPHILPVTIGSL